jgi:hypothetical protein
MAAQNLLQPWPEATKDLSIEKIYQKAHQRANELLPRFQSLLEPYVPADSRLLTNIKSLSSFVRKANRKSVRTVHDVLRAAILTQTKDEAKDVAHKLKALNVVEYDSKNDPEHVASGYYGSWHIKIKLADMICEIQVMPETLWIYKERNHATYTSNEAEKDPSVKTFSHWLYDTANKESA